MSKMRVWQTHKAKRGYGGEGITRYGNVLPKMREYDGEAGTEYFGSPHDQAISRLVAYPCDIFSVL